MKKCVFICSAFSALICNSIFAQTFVRDLNILVSVNGIQLDYPWAGGLTSPIFNTMDLNNDGFKDLIISEPVFRSVTIFINDGITGIASYSFAPQYLPLFQNFKPHFFLKDYNCDGIEDVFVYNFNGGLTAYKNTGTAGNPQFVLAYNLLTTEILGTSANLYVGSGDVPAFVDIDGDGDMDILSPMAVSSQIYFYENKAMDQFGVCDTLIFETQLSSWGLKSSLSSSSCLLVKDFDNDVDFDLITNNYFSGWTGSATGNSLLYFENVGTIGNDSLVLIDHNFPSYSVPTIASTFISSYSFDADNDGWDDLITAEGFVTSAESVNPYFYKNIPSGSISMFYPVDSKFISKGMIDHGRASVPKLIDIVNDGLKDLIVGVFSVGNNQSSLFYYRNTGTSANPAFELIDSDFASTASLGSICRFPSFGDMDSDGDIDMIMGWGLHDIAYYQNTAGAGNPCHFVLMNQNITGVPNGSQPKPFIFDIDQDGLPDIIAGNTHGSLRYYRNIGTLQNPAFQLETSQWGGIDFTSSGSYPGYTFPFLHFVNGTIELLVGTGGGNIVRYNNVSALPGAVFNAVDSAFGSISEPAQVAFDIADINADGLPELVTGSGTGGLVMYTMLATGLSTFSTIDSDVKIYPNPAYNFIQLTIPDFYSDTHATIYNMPGECLRSISLAKKKDCVIPVYDLSQGMYFLTVTDGKNFSYYKFI